MNSLDEITYSGSITGVVVEAGKTTNAGTITMIEIGDHCQERLDEEDWEQILIECIPENMNTLQLLTAGKIGLINNAGSEALPYFNEVGTSETEFGGAQYGILMAHFQQLGDQLNESLSLLDMISAMGSSSIKPQQGDIWESLIVSMGGTNNIIDIMEAIQTQALIVVNNGYTLTLDDFPFLIGAPGDAVYVHVSVSGENGELAARTLWMAADLVIAVINYLGAHAWDLNLSDMMSHMDDITDVMSGIEGEDLIGLARDFAWLPQGNPNFFSKSERWTTNITTIKSVLSSGAANVKVLDSAIADTTVSSASTCERSICLIDVDSSGTISSGDQLYVDGDIHVKLGN